MSDKNKISIAELIELNEKIDTLSIVAAKHYDDMIEYAVKVCAAKLGVKSDDVIKSEDTMSKLEEVAFSMLCQLELSEAKELLDDKKMQALLKNVTIAGPKLERCVKQVYKGMYDKEKKKSGKVSSDKKKKLKSSSWAICRSQGLSTNLFEDESMYGGKNEE